MRKNIKNDKPIIGKYDVNHEGSSDMYFKGSNILHTLRQLIDNDVKWRTILRGLNKDFYHQTVTTQQIEQYLSKHANIDLTSFFDQYLRNTKIPTLEYDFDDQGLKYRYTNVVEGFNMPIRVQIDKKDQWIHPTSEWQQLKTKATNITVDPNFYIHTKSI